MQDTVMEVTAKCLFLLKLRPNPSEMKVRAFVSIKKVIWDQVRFLRLKLSRIRDKGHGEQIIIGLSHCPAVFLSFSFVARRGHFFI